MVVKRLVLLGSSHSVYILLASYVLMGLYAGSKHKQGDVDQKVSGSVQMLFDTRCFSEGDYILEIEHSLGGKHRLHFKKYTEGFVPEKLRLIKPKSIDESMREIFW